MDNKVYLSFRVNSKNEAHRMKNLARIVKFIGRFGNDLSIRDDYPYSSNMRNHLKKAIEKWQKH